jgi:hypothetical protein
MFYLLFLVVLAYACMQLLIFRNLKLRTEDAMAASALACAVIDVQEYGISHLLLIPSEEEAYELYRTALRHNLRLNEAWESDETDGIAGPVKVWEFIIYQVRGDDVWVSYFGESGSGSYTQTGGLGTIRMPDQTLVESTSIYSRIGFPVKGFLGIQLYAWTDIGVDIVSSVADDETGPSEESQPESEAEE